MWTPSRKVSLFALCASFVALRIFTQWIPSDHVNQLVRRSTLAAVVILLSYFVYRRVVFVQQLNKLPGLKSYIGLTGYLQIVMVNARRTGSIAVGLHEVISSAPMLRAEKEDVGLYSLFIGPMPVVIVTSPDAIRTVLHHKHSQKKGKSYDSIRAALGDGLLTSHGLRWTAHRKLLTPAFHFKILESLMSIVIPQSNVLLSQLEKEAESKHDRSIDNLSSHIFDTTLDILCQSSMGLDSTDELNVSRLKSCMSRWFDMFATISVTPWMWIPGLLRVTPFGREYNSYARLTRSFADQVINRRMNLLKKRMNDEASDDTASPSKPAEPFMDTMIHQHLRDAESFSLEDIRDETNVFSVAGRDTTGWSVIYTLFLLGHHQDVQEKLYQELQEFLGDGDLDELTSETVKRFKYLDALYSESLRLYTPAPLITRFADEAIEIDGKVIPKGSEILLAIGTMHRDPVLWPEPHRFKPERFFAPLNHPYCFVPFAAGPRNCIGQKYAKIQAKSLIISIVRKYRIFSVTQVDQVVTFFAPVLHSQTPIKVRLSPRDTVSI